VFKKALAEIQEVVKGDDDDEVEEEDMDKDEDEDEDIAARLEPIREPMLHILS